MPSLAELSHGKAIRYSFRKLQPIIGYLCLATTAAFVIAKPLSAQSCEPGYRIITLSANDSVGTVYGPVCVVVPINGLRYTGLLKLQTTTTFVDPTSVFLAAGGTGTPETLAGIGDTIIALKSQMSTLQQGDQKATVALNKGVSSITAVVAMSDVVYQQTNGAQAIANQLKADPFVRDLAEARAARFKTSDDLYKQANTLQLIALDLQLNKPPKAASDQALLAADLAAIKDLTDSLAAYLSGADKTVAFIKQRQIFDMWDSRISALSPDNFFVVRNVHCHTIGEQSKAISVVLNRTDLLPTLTGGAPTSADAATSVVTVSCPSSFSISGGMEMSFIKTYSYGLIPTATPGSLTYGVINTTSFNPMPIAMLHERLFESKGRKYALQLGFGVAAHTQDDTAGGTGAEYLLGAGVSLFHTIYVTPGWHAGRIAALSPGYKVGDAVATGVTAAPIVDKYTSGFGLAITFTKP